MQFASRGVECAMVSLLRDAVRGLRSHSGFSALAFAIFAIAIGAGTVTYSVVCAIVLRPLPFITPERLVAIPSIMPSGGVPSVSTPQDYYAWREQAGAFESLGAFVFGGALRAARSGQSLSLSTGAVSTNLFEVLGVHAARGRLFTAGDGAQASAPVLVLSYETWVRRFGADPHAIGERLEVGATSWQIVGVLAPGVSYPVQFKPVDAYVPYIPSATDLDYRSVATRGLDMSMDVVGRLRPGVSIDQARADIERLSGVLAAAVPGTHLPRPIVTPLLDFVVGPAKSWLLLVLAAVTLVILAACVNVANLLLTRGSLRARELATREALGATRSRIRWSLILEGLFLTISASAAGVGLSVWGVHLAKSNLPAGLARASTIAIDGRVLAMAVAITIMSGLATSSIPAWLVSRADLVTFLKSGGSIVSNGRSRRRSLSTLLVAEVAMVTTILVATLLVVASYVLVSTADLGFDRRDVLAFGYSQDLQGVAKADRPAAIAAFQSALLARVSAVPGVTAAALSSNGPPLVGGSARYSMVIPGYGEARDHDMLEMHPISPGYISMMGIRLLRGRDVTSADRIGTPPVAIIDDSAAQRFFGGRDPVGQVVTFRGDATTIVGLVHNVRFHGPEPDVLPQVYVPIAQASVDVGDLLVRSVEPTAPVAAGVVQAVRPLVGSRSVQPRYLADSFRALTASRRFNAGLLSVFGAVATVIGLVGIYGVVTFAVAQQVKAIGLRIALGATRSHVLRLVFKEALRPTAAGIVIGLGGAYLSSGLARALVFEIAPTSTMVYCSVAAIVTGVALSAAIIPATRAARIDPLIALRAE